MWSLAQISSGAIRCSFNNRFRAKFRRVPKRVPVQIPAQVPEVLVQIPGEVSEGSGADLGSGADTC